jgi:hypothetical protein
MTEKNKGGRPLKFKTVEELQSAIDKYFSSCNEETEPMTITGLAIALDTDRKTLCNYEDKPEFFDTIKMAKLRVENAYEKRLVKRGNGGDIFALKNFNWVDKQEIAQDITTKGESIAPTVTQERISELAKKNVTK